MLARVQGLTRERAVPRRSSVCFLRSGIATLLAVPEICLPILCIDRVGLREAIFQDLNNIIQSDTKSAVSVHKIDVVNQFPTVNCESC